MDVGESEYPAVLKTRNLLIFRDAQSAENGEIVPNWNVSGTRDFLPHCAVFQSNKRNRAPGHDYPFVFENSLEFQFAPIVAVQHRWDSTLNLDPVQRHHHVFAFQPLP